MIHTRRSKIIYTASEQQDVPIGKHAYDNNALISKYVSEDHPTTMNQLEIWRALKQLEIPQKQYQKDLRTARALHGMKN